MLILEETESDKIALLTKAIESKVEISFWYRGLDYLARKKRGATNAKQGWRHAQPTDLGRSKASNKLMLRAYQGDQWTTNTNKNAWKTFLVDEMSRITILDGEGGKYYKPFQEPSGSGYNRTGDEKIIDDKSNIKLDFDKKPIDNQNNKTINKEPIEEPINNNEPVDEPINNNEPEVEELTENTSFSKWILNLSYGSK
jgi:hypothetical protein